MRVVLLRADQAQDPIHEQEDGETDATDDRDADEDHVAGLLELLGLGFARHAQDTGVLALPDGAEFFLDLALGIPGLVHEGAVTHTGRATLPPIMKALASFIAGVPVRAPMRAFWIVLLLPLSGCLSSDEAPAEPQLSVFVFDSIQGADLRDGSVDWMVRIANEGDQANEYTIAMDALHGTLSLATPTGLAVLDAAAPLDATLTLDPGTSHLIVIRSNDPTADRVNTTVTSQGSTVLAHERSFHETLSGAVSAGQHVQTMTVGVWVNGTSFYTNMAEMLLAPGFPAGGNINRSAAMQGALPLPIYVYDRDRSEQPPASKDTCHFTTIPGYNALLKTQDVGTGNVRFLHPEEAYTRAGSEDHLLYGDALIFYNIVVAIDGDAHADVDGPAQGGACYDFQNTRDFYGLPEEVPAPPTSEPGELFGIE